MEKWNLIIDVEKCEDCNNCLLACKDEHVDNEFANYSVPQQKHGNRWIDILRKERGQYPFIDVAYVPVPCFHCDDAPCVKAAKEGAVYKRDDGIVLIDPRKAKGQKKIVQSCPYDLIWWNEDQDVAQKCTLCAHLLDDKWPEPRCVDACPTGALQIAKTSDSVMKERMQEEDLRFFKGSQKTQSRVFYKNLHRYDKCFIGGSVATTRDKVSDCVENAEVALLDNMGRTIDSTQTDTFGDFKFDGLAENSGHYTLKISHPDFGEKVLDLDLKASQFVGIIDL